MITTIFAAGDNMVPFFALNTQSLQWGGQPPQGALITFLLSVGKQAYNFFEHLRDVILAMARNPVAVAAVIDPDGWDADFGNTRNLKDLCKDMDALRLIDLPHVHLYELYTLFGEHCFELSAWDAFRSRVKSDQAGLRVW
jgi:hypothetical protein